MKKWPALLVLMLLPGMALAQPYELDIRSDSLNIDNSSNHAVFEGNVVVVHDELTLKADKVDVFYTRTGDGGRSVEEVRALGHVIMEREARTATGERGVYRPAREEVVLYDNVTVQQGANQTLYGTKMRYDMVEGRVSLTADSERVRARLGAEN
mgnify:CR=1 FL=1